MGVRSQQRKVARPTSISFDQLSVKEDTLTAEIDPNFKAEDKKGFENQPDSNVGDVVSSVINKYKKERDSDKQILTISKIDSPAQSLTQGASDQKGNSEQGEQVDVTEESKLADQIRNQAKAIADEQLKQQ